LTLEIIEKTTQILSGGPESMAKSHVCESLSRQLNISNARKNNR